MLPHRLLSAREEARLGYNVRVPEKILHGKVWNLKESFRACPEAERRSFPLSTGCVGGGL